MFMQIAMLSLLSLFYIIYFVKALILKKQGISVDLLGRGDKPKKAVYIEVALKSITYLGAAIQFISALFPSFIWSFSVPLQIQIVGTVLAVIGVTLFAVSVMIMRDNWRAGFDKNQDTNLVTSGVYKFSRNPAFVGFDLLYIGCAISFPNIAMVAIAITAVAAFHIQILGEEKFLTGKFGQAYTDYKENVRRYL